MIFLIQESIEMDIGSSSLHVTLVRSCAQLIELKSGARLCCPADGNSVLVRGSLEASYFASEMIAVCEFKKKIYSASFTSVIQNIRLGRDSTEFKVQVPIICGVQ